MKKKNGFISISIVYSMFILFLLLLVLIMTSYINNRYNYGIIKNDLKDSLQKNYEYEIRKLPLSSYIRAKSEDSERSYNSDNNCTFDSTKKCQWRVFKETIIQNISENYLPVSYKSNYKNNTKITFNSSTQYYKSEYTKSGDSDYVNIEIPEENGFGNYTICFNNFSANNTFIIKMLLKDETGVVKSEEEKKKYTGIINNHDVDGSNNPINVEDICYPIGYLYPHDTIKLEHATSPNVTESNDALSFTLKKLDATIIDAGIRFEGNNPNNYFCFSDNCKSFDGSKDARWRIIGIFEGSSLGNKNPGKWYTKLVLSEPAYTGSYDSRVKNYREYTLRKSILYNTTWYNNTFPEVNSGKFYSDYYLLERNLTTPTVPSNTSTSEVGLIYPSDYMFAAFDGGTCKESTINGVYFNSSINEDCAYYDWLGLNSKGDGFINQWTITNNGSSSAYTINPNLTLTSKTAVTPVIRPVIYLQSNVRIKSGNGSWEHPYILYTTE